jgi:hypothetical protein
MDEDYFNVLVATVNPVAMFSPTSPTRTHAHHLLNTRQSIHYQDLQQYVLYKVLLAPGP